MEITKQYNNCIWCQKPLQRIGLMTDQMVKNIWTGSIGAPTKSVGSKTNSNENMRNQMVNIET